MDTCPDKSKNQKTRWQIIETFKLDSRPQNGHKTRMTGGKTVCHPHLGPLVRTEDYFFFAAAAFLRARSSASNMIGVPIMMEA